MRILYLKSSIFNILFLGVLFLVISIDQCTALKCISNNDVQVDWIFARKLPQTNNYIYLDSISNNITHLLSLDSKTSFLGKNLDSLNSSGISYALYNDQPWRDDTTGSIIEPFLNSSIEITQRSLGKGIIAIDKSTSTGYHIIHSMPGFPSAIDHTQGVFNFKLPSAYPDSWLPVDDIMGYSGSSSLSDLGHVYFCQSLDSQQSITSLLEVLSYSQPYIYRSNDLVTFSSLLNPPQPPISIDIKSAIINTNSSTTLTTSTEQSVWQFYNQIPTANKKISSLVGVNVITETHLPFDFYSKYPAIKTSRWRSSNEAGHIGFSNFTSNVNNRVCIGEIFNQEMNYFRSETIVCVNSTILRDFLYLSSYEQRDLNNVESVIGQQIIFKGPIQFTNQLNNLFSSDESLLVYYEALQDTLIRNTNIEILINNSGLVDTSIVDSLTNLLLESDSNGLVTINKNYQPSSFNLVLSSTTENVKLVDNSYSIHKVPLTIFNGSFILDQPTETDSNLLLIYNTILLLNRKTTPILLESGILNPIDIAIYYSQSNSSVQINQSPIIINIADGICMDSLFRAYSHNVITKLNLGLAYNISLQSNFNGISVGSSNEVFIRGLINSLSLYYRQQIFKSLPDSILETISQCDTLTTSINIEYFSNYQMLKSDNGYLFDGWVSAFFNDILDSNIDSRDQVNFINDNYKLSLSKFLQAITSFTFDPANDKSIFDFISLIEVQSNSTSVSTIKQYNNIFQCSYCSSGNSIPITNTSNLEEYFLNKGVCQNDIDSVGIDVLQTYALLWAFNNTITTEPDFTTIWQSNRGLATFYSDPNLFTKLEQLQNNKYISEERVVDCNLYPISGNPITPKSFIELTQLFVDLMESAIVIENQTQSFNLQYYYYPPSDQVSPSLAIVTLNGGICAFDFVPPSYIDSQQVYSICPTQPVIYDVIGLSGPTNQTHQITITGQQLKYAKVQFGNDECVVDQLSATWNQIICTVPKGVGIIDLVITNPQQPSAPPLLPIVTNYPYQFIFDAPYIISYSSLERSLATNEYQSEFTIIGQNFIGETLSIDSVDLVINQEQIVKPIQLFTLNSEDYIVFKPTIGCGAGNSLAVRVAGQYQTNADGMNITYLAPTLISFDVTSSNTNGGATITLTGTNFGTIDNIATGAFIGQQVEFDQVEWLSDTKIRATVPVGYSKDQQITVQICNQVTGQLVDENGNDIEDPAPLFSYEPPVLYEILYEPIPTNTLGSEFYITGKNLATKEFTPDVYLESDFNFTMECYSYSAIFYMGKVYKDENDNPIPTPTEQPVDGPYDPFIDMNPSYRDNEDFDCFGCVMYFGASSGIGLTVAVGNQNVSTNTLNTTLPNTILKYMQPSINSTLNSTNIPTNTNGVKMTVFGQNFVPNEHLNLMEFDNETSLDGGLHISNVTLDSKYNCTDIEWINSTMIVCTVGYGIGIHNISIFVGSQPLENYGEHQFKYEPPTINSVQPDISDTVGGVPITIVGSNFVPNELLPPGAPSIDGGLLVSNVSFIRNFTGPNGQLISTNITCQQIQWIDSSTVECVAPFGIGKNYSVAVYVGKQLALNFGEHKWSYTPPFAKSLSSQISNSTRGGYSITIKGNNFVPNEKVSNEISIDGGVRVSNVSIDGSLSASIVWVNSTTIFCSLPPGIGKDLSLSVIVGEQQLSNFGDIKFSYDPPTLSSKKYLVPVGYEGEIQLIGTNFVPESLAVKMNQQPQNYTLASITIGGISCRSIRWINDTHANCTVPYGTGKNKFINVTIGGQSISGTNDYLSYLPPNITSISPNQGRNLQKTIITINGDSFGISNSQQPGFVPQPIILVNQTTSMITNITLLSSKRIICTIEPAQIGTYDITVKLNGQESNATQWRSYGLPKINSIKPKGGSINGGYPITITGENLVEHNNNPPKVYMNNVEIVATKASSTEIIFSAAKDGGKNIPIYVYLNGEISNTNTDFAYDAPAIYSVTPATIKSETPTRTTITLSGQDLGLVGMQLEITVGTTSCINIVIQTSASVMCDAPFGLVGPQTLTLKFKGQSAINAIIYTKQTDEPVVPGIPVVGGGSVASPPPTAPPGGVGSIIPSLPPIPPIPIIPIPPIPGDNTVIIQYTNDITYVYNVGAKFGYSRKATSRITFNATLSIKKESNNNQTVIVTNPRSVKTYKTTLSLTTTSLLVTTSYISLVADVFYRGVNYQSVLFQSNQYTVQFTLPNLIKGFVFVDNTYNLVYEPTTTDKPAVNVRMTIYEPVLGQSYTITSGATDGSYEFAMPAGVYLITFPDLQVATQNLVVTSNVQQITTMSVIGSININNNAGPVTYNFPLDPRVTDCRSYVLSGTNNRLNYQLGQSTLTPLQFCYSPTVCAYPITYTNNVAGAICTTTTPTQTSVNLQYSGSIALWTYTDNQVTGMPNNIIPAGVTFTVYSTNLAKTYGPFTPASGYLVVQVPPGTLRISLTSPTFTPLLNNMLYGVTAGGQTPMKFGFVQNSLYNNLFTRFYDQPNFTGQTMSFPSGLYNTILNAWGWTNIIKSFQSPAPYYVYLYSQNNPNSLITNIANTGNVVVTAPTVARIEISYGNLNYKIGPDGSWITLPYPSSYMAYIAVKYTVIPGRDMELNCNAQSQCFVPSGFGSGQLNLYYNGQLLNQKYLITFDKLYNIPAPLGPGIYHYLDRNNPTKNYLGVNEILSLTVGQYRTDFGVLSTGVFLKVYYGGTVTTLLDIPASTIPSTATVPYILQFNADSSICIKGTYKCVGPSANMKLNGQYLQLVEAGMIIQNSLGDVIFSLIMPIPRPYTELLYPIHFLSRSVNYLDSTNSARPNSIMQLQYMTNGEQYLRLESNGELSIYRMPLPTSNTPTLFYTTSFNFAGQVQPFKLTLKSNSDLCISDGNGVDKWCSHTENLSGRYFAVIPPDLLSNRFGTYIVTADGRMVWGDLDNYINLDFVKYIKPMYGSYLSPSDYLTQYKQYGLPQNEVLTNSRSYLLLNAQGIVNLYSSNPFSPAQAATVLWTSGGSPPFGGPYTLQIITGTVYVCGPNPTTQRYAIASPFAASSSFLNLNVPGTVVNKDWAMLIQRTTDHQIVGGLISDPTIFNTNNYIPKSSNPSTISNSYIYANVASSGTIVKLNNIKSLITQAVVVDTTQFTAVTNKRYIMITGFPELIIAQDRVIIDSLAIYPNKIK